MRLAVSLISLLLVACSAEEDRGPIYDSASI